MAPRAETCSTSWQFITRNIASDRKTQFPVTSGVPTTVPIKLSVSWDVAPFNLVTRHIPEVTKLYHNLNVHLRGNLKIPRILFPTAMLRHAIQCAA